MSVNQPVPSPCVKRCKLDAQGAYCLGCQRSLDEISHWSRYSDAQKLAVWERLRAGQPKPVPRTKSCQECGSEFSCGTCGPDGGCWCNQLPNVLPLEPGRDCLCPACLEARLRAEFAARGLPYPEPKPG